MGTSFGWPGRTPADPLLFQASARPGPLDGDPEKRGFYPRSIRRTRSWSASETRVAFLRWRLRPVAFLVRMCRFIDLWRLILPLAVRRKRFAAARRDLSLSFFFGFLIGGSPGRP